MIQELLPQQLGVRSVTDPDHATATHAQIVTDARVAQRGRADAAVALRLLLALVVVTDAAEAPVWIVIGEELIADQQTLIGSQPSDAIEAAARIRLAGPCRNEAPRLAYAIAT